MATVEIAMKPANVGEREESCSAKPSMAKQGEGLKQYYLQHIHDLQLQVRQNSHNLNRLEAQRNELNSRVNKAFQYSTITSVTLLDCFTIAWVIILTWLVLGTWYSLWQFVGAAICVLGLALVLLSDAGVGGGGGSIPLVGDIFVIAGTFFFAISNTSEEFCVKRKDRVEVVAMIGVFGTLVSVCEMYPFTRDFFQRTSRLFLLASAYDSVS